MCTFLAPLLAAGGTAAAGATAAGAAAAAATAAPAMAMIGTAVSAAGSLMQGIQGAQAARQQASMLNREARQTIALNAVQDQRTRARMESQTRQQFAELAARGVQLDSPTAILLGQNAAQEMSFESQAVRSQGAARASELTASAQIARGRARQSMMQGVFGAASSILTGAPQIWPELLK